MTQSISDRGGSGSVKTCCLCYSVTHAVAQSQVPLNRSFRHLLFKMCGGPVLTVMPIDLPQCPVTHGN